MGISVFFMEDRSEEFESWVATIPVDDAEPHHYRLDVHNHCGSKSITYRHWNPAMPVCAFYTGKMGLASELSKLFPGRPRPGIHPRLIPRPLPVLHGSRRFRVPTVHSKVDSKPPHQLPVPLPFVLDYRPENKIIPGCVSVSSSILLRGAIKRAGFAAF